MRVPICRDPSQKSGQWPVSLSVVTTAATSARETSKLRTHGRSTLARLSQKKNAVPLSVTKENKKKTLFHDTLCIEVVFRTVNYCYLVKAYDYGPHGFSFISFVF